MHPDTREETLWSGYRMSCLSPLTRRRWVGWSFGLEFTWFGGAVRGDLVDSEEKIFPCLAEQLASVATLRSESLEGHLPPLSHVLL